MLVFPERVLQGDIPNKDFLHLYGPGSLWALAGAFKVFGVSLLTERFFGLAQQMAVVFGIYALARAWGRRLAVGCALLAGLILVPFGLTALAWVGAIGLGLLGLTCGLVARRRTDERVARRWALLAGLLLGVALLFRPDLVLAVGLATVALVRGAGRTRTRWLFAGAALGLLPYVIHVATAGPGNVIDGMILDPVFHLRGGRSLPIPPSWGHLDGFLQRAGALEQLSWPIPALELSQQLFVWFFFLLGSIGLLAFVAWQRHRQAPAATRTRTLVVVAMFSIGLVPQAVQRVDSAHFAWVGCVPMAFLPIVVFELVRSRARARDVPAGRLALASVGGVFLAIVLVIPRVHRAHIPRLQRAVLRVPSHRAPDRARRPRLLLRQAGSRGRSQPRDRRSRAHRAPGDRLFVGPANLRKTPYSDAYLYFMLPELDPAHVLHRDGSRCRERRGLWARGGSRLRRSRHPLVHLGRLERAQRLPQERIRRGATSPRPGFLPGRHLPRPLPALPQVQLSRACTR